MTKVHPDSRLRDLSLCRMVILLFSKRLLDTNASACGYLQQFIVRMKFTSKKRRRVGYALGQTSSYDAGGSSAARILLTAEARL
jgi:hypothetical protein